jgi:coniferyl-aldehyde dehydrogenase
MSILETTANGVADDTADDTAAIAHLGRSFVAQRAAFTADRKPSRAQRRERLGALMGMLAANRTRISEALNADFGVHPGPASDLIEVLGPLGRAQYVLDHLEEWMAPEPRDIDPHFFGSAKAYVEFQPKGVIGNIVPWNFPFDRQTVRIYSRLR